MTTPVISAVSGTISTGSLLTITGTNMIAEDRTNYDSWFTATRSGFAGANVGADGWDTSYSAPDLIYDTTVKLRGSKSMRMLMTGVHLWPTGDGVPWGWPVATANSVWSSGQPKDVYIRGYSRWNYFDSVTGLISWPRNVPTSGNPTPSKKHWWADNSGITGWSLQYGMNSDGSPPTSWHVELTTRITGIDERTELGTFPALQNNKWYCMEFHFVKAGSGGPYVVEGWVDGVLTASVSAVAGFDPSNTGSIHSKVNEWNTNATWQGFEWCDELAVSTSRIRPLCVVEIGDSSTYASAHPKYQYPEFFTSDSSVQFNCDLTGLTGPNYWMWVTDSAGNRSVTAFSLTGGPDTTPPNLSSANAGTPTSVGTQNASVVTDDATGTLYWTTYTDGSTPTPTDAQVKAHSGTGAQGSSAYGSQAVASTGTKTVPVISGLSASTPYDIYFAHEDAAGNLSTKLKADLTTTAADVRPPVLTNPTAGTVTSSGCIGSSVDTDEANGILYRAVMTAGGSCTNDQLIAGSGGNILSGYDWSKIVTATGAQQGTPNIINGLSESTIYRIVFLHVDAAGNPSAQSTVDFTTLVDVARTLFFTEGFEDASFAARGWFDLAGGTIDNVVFSPRGGAGAINIHWGIGATQVVTPKRHAIPASETVYLKFDVKFGTSGVTWQGSGHTYHPHMFQILTDADDEWIGPSQTNLSVRVETSVFKPRVNFGDSLRIFTTNAYPDETGTYPHNNAAPSLLGTSADHAVWGGNGIQSGSGANFFDEGTSWDNTAEYLSASNNFVNDTWHTVEIYLQMNTVTAGVPAADGIAKYWVDGVLVINKSALYLRTGAFATQKFKTVLLVPYIGDGSPIAQDMWIDNLEVWDVPPTVPDESSADWFVREAQSKPLKISRW